MNSSQSAEPTELEKPVGALKRIGPVVAAFALLIGIAAAGEALTRDETPPAVNHTQHVLDIEVGGVSGFSSTSSPIKTSPASTTVEQPRDSSSPQDPAEGSVQHHTQTPVPEPTPQTGQQHAGGYVAPHVAPIQPEPSWGSGGDWNGDTDDDADDDGDDVDIADDGDED